MRVDDRSCLVVGGGPAGCTVAMRLAQLGCAVELFEHGRAHHSGPFETVVASNQMMFERAGLRTLLEQVAEVDGLRHGAIWGSEELVWRDPDATGYLLRRGSFDEALRAHAAQQGVDVRCPRRFDGAHDSRLLAIASGRAGNIADLPKPRRIGPATTAITMLGEPDEQDRGTAVVEAVAQGWLWTHVPVAGSASVVMLCDTDWLASGDKQERLQRMCGAARGPAGRLRDTRVVRANDASAARREPVSHALVLGDAAATIDPLASQGVEKAFAAADHAAAVMMAAIERPEWRERLLLCHHRWEVGLQEAHQRTTAEFYQRETRFRDAPFWQRRCLDVAQPPTAQPLGSGMLCIADTVTRCGVLVRRGETFMEVDGARETGSVKEFAYVGRVPVTALLELLETPRTVEQVVAAAARLPNLFVLSPRDVHDAVAHLWALGWLKPVSSGAGEAGSR